MIRFTPLPFGWVTFCDDVRQEVHGKLTLVGTYGNELIVFGNGPHALPQLCAQIVFRADPAELPERLTLKIILLSTDEIVLWQFEHPMRDQMSGFPAPSLDPRGGQGQLYAEVRTVARFAPFIISEECTLSARAYVGEDEFKLGSLRLRIEAAVEASNAS